MRYDLIIVGGGLVGAGLAAALQMSGLQIALIDARMPSSNDPRLFALNAGSCQFLDNLNLWDELSSFASPIHQVHISEQGRFGAVRLNRDDVHLSSLGHVIPARYIEGALNERLLSLPNVTLYRPATLKTLEQDSAGVILTIEKSDGTEVLTSKLVIAADGTASTVRSLLNIKTEVFDYEQSALVTRTILARPHAQIAYERFQDDGAIAMLPLINNECATIWSASTDRITELMNLSDADFLAALQESFGYRLGRLKGISQRHVFPLKMVQAEKAVEGNVFLLGNAAHTLHPIAAQGFNLALYEVAILVETILAKRDEIHAADLQRVSEKIKKQQKTSIGVSHRISQVFASKSRLAAIATQLGMMGLDIATPLKRHFISGIMGRSGRVPRLLLNTKDL
ncbi:MAG: FAD-dependent monooxygenase [Gammaproteobacteria bacterium]